MSDKKLTLEFLHVRDTKNYALFATPVGINKLYLPIDFANGTKKLTVTVEPAS